MDLQSLERIAILNAENDYIEMEMNEEGQASMTQGHSQAQSMTQPTQTPRPRPARRTRRRTPRIQPVRPKRLRAKWWLEFTSVGIEEDGRERARCHHCGIKLVIYTKSLGTSTLNLHLGLCPNRPPSIDRPQYDHKIDREMTSEIIIYHDLPFRYVEYEKARARDTFLNPDCQLICRQTAGADVYKRYEIEKAKLIEFFSKYQGRVSSTADFWSACSTVMGYICVTAHYIDDSWRLINKILAFCDFKPPHNGEEIAKKIYDSLMMWGLEKKVISITLDNAKANNSMLKIIKHRLGNGRLCDGKFLHVRYSSHVLNLIVKAGLDVASSLLENIRNSVKFVKGYELRKESFATCVESLGIKGGAGLSLDFPTRWNSTYEMLARALKFRKVFGILNFYERDYSSLPSEEEWDQGEKIYDMLKPFHTIATYFQE